MTTYKKAGVDIDKGDLASALAYQAAQATFKSRQNKIGRAVIQEGGFTGLIDMGPYYLVQNCDGVGTKVEIAEQMKKFDTLGYDLVAMVADDAICVGAETFALINTIDTNKVDPKVVKPLMQGLKKVCLEQKIIIPGGEIAELGDAVKGIIWNSTALGILEKKKFISGRGIKPGDQIIGLQSRGFRSNGFTLIRYILKKKFGPNWVKRKLNPRQTWGQATLTPSLVYQRGVLDMIGEYKKPAKVKIKGIVHVTGGGIPGNIKRILKSSRLGAELNNLPKPHLAMLKLQEIGKVPDREAYRTWNMGVGMILIASKNQTAKIQKIAQKNKLKSKIIGQVTKNPAITLTSQGHFSAGKPIQF